MKKWTVHTRNFSTARIRCVRVGPVHLPEQCRLIYLSASSKAPLVLWYFAHPYFPTAPMSRQQTISPAEIERLIGQNEPVVIHEGYALNLGKWIDNHPGGRLAILHMVGRDATDEINM